jgi:cyclohexa-1,5-dienecarbonyl-CoA hydratase
LFFVENLFQRIALTIDPPVVRISLRNPPVNVVDVSMMSELARALAELEDRAEVSVIVIGGEGKSFSAGVDVAAHTPDQVEAMLAKFHAMIRALVGSRKVTIAAVQGNCFGGGAELAMVCDLVYTTDSARWGFPEIKLGCYPPVACAALAALVGQKKASELILTGRAVSGTEAAAIGLANHAVAEDELEAAVARTVEELVTLSPAALAITKKALYSWDAAHFDKGLARAEKIYREELMKTADAREGIDAFMEKRPARWSGK